MTEYTQKIFTRLTSVKNSFCPERNSHCGLTKFYKDTAHFFPLQKSLTLECTKYIKMPMDFFF